MNTKARIVFEGDDKVSPVVEAVQRNLAGLSNSVVSATSILGTLGVASAALTFGSVVKGAIDAADTLNKLSQRTGLATESLSQWQYAARLADVSNESLATGIKKLNISIAEGLAGNKEKIELFKALNITTADLGKGTEAVMLKMADAYSTAKDGAGKVAIGNGLMGKSADEMIPLFNGGSKAIKDLMQQANRLGLTVSTEFAQQAEQFNDNLTILKLSSDRLAISMAENLVGGLSKATKAMADAALQGGKLSGIVAFIQTLFTGDDQHKSNVAITQLTDQVLAAQDAMDKARARGDEATTKRLTERVKKLREEISMHQGFAKMMQETAKAAEDAKPRQDKDLKAPAAKSDTTKSLYDQINDELRKRADLVKAEADAGTKLSEGRKFEVEILAKLEAGYGKLTQAQVAELKAKVAAVRGSMEAIDLRKSEFDQAMDIAKARQKLREDEYKAGQEGVRQALEDSNTRNRVARETLENIQFETSLLGLNTREREQATAMRELERQGIRQGTEAWDLYAQAIQQAIAARSGIQQGIDDFSRLWSEIDSTGRDTFRSIGDSWKGTVQRMKDTVKNTLFDYLYQVAARPILFQLAAQVSGASSGAVASVANSTGLGTGTVGNALSMAGSANNLLQLSGFGSGSSIFSQFATSGVGNALGLSTTVDAIGGIGTASTALSGAGSAFAAAMPWVSAALIAGSLLDKKRGGPKTIGGGQEAGNIQASILATLEQFGASTTGLRVGGFSAADPQGDALTQLQTALFSGDRALYSRQDRLGGFENVGRSQEELAAAWAEETARITLAALQARLGPQYQQYLEGLDANTSSVDDINAGLTRVNQARALEARLLELTSTDAEKLAEARRQERKTFPPALQGMLDRIYAEQDLKRAADEATQALSRRTEALAYATGLEDNALAAVGRAIEAQRTILQAQRDAAAERVAEISGVFNTVSEAVRDLWAQTTATTAMAAREGSSLIAGALAAAKTTGYLPSQASLAEAIGAVRGGIAATPYASERERAFDQLVLAGQLSQLKTISGSQLTEAERTLNVAEEQLDQLQRTYDIAREQVEATRTGTLTIAQALTGLKAALEAGATVRGAAQGGAGGTGGMLSNADIAAWAAPRAGVSEAANLALYNDALAARDRGVTLAKIDEAVGLPAGTSAAWAIANGKQLFATGAAFTNGVVTRPTAFDIGVMGEKDPEGILPLTNVGGRLGVDARTNNVEIVAALRANSTAIESLGKRLDGIQAATERAADILGGKQRIPLLVEMAE